MKIQKLKEFLVLVVSGRMNVSWLINWSHYYMPGAASCTNIYCSRKAGGTAATIYTCIYYVLNSQERSRKKRRQQHEFPHNLLYSRIGQRNIMIQSENIYRVTRGNLFLNQRRLKCFCFLFCCKVLNNVLFIWYYNILLLRERVVVQKAGNVVNFETLDRLQLMIFRMT